MQNVEDYLLGLAVNYRKLFTAVEKGSRKTSDSLLVMVVPKEKLAGRKWMSAVCGKEVTAQEKIECLTTFVPHDFHEKKFTQKI